MPSIDARSREREVEQLLAAAPAKLPLRQSGFRPETGALGLQSLKAADAAVWFPNAREPDGALAGLLLRTGYWAESHAVAQDLHSAEGSYWHAIAHRMEPDAFNAGYWFRQVGKHAIFPELLRRATEILARNGPGHWRLKPSWDPFLFIEWCGEAAGVGQAEAAAMEIQMAEWQLLFDWCRG